MSIRRIAFFSLRPSAMTSGAGGRYAHMGSKRSGCTISTLLVSLPNAPSVRPITSSSLAELT